MEQSEFEKLKLEHEQRIKDLEESENFLHYDFQGWPIFKKTLRELLIELGATEENGVIGFKTDNDILNCYAQSLEEDGMGYGIFETDISLADASEDKEGKKIVRFWRDKKWEQKAIEESKN